jgi:hypothetical protein
MIDRLYRIIERIENLILYYENIEQYEVCQQLHQYHIELNKLLNEANLSLSDDI